MKIGIFAKTFSRPTIEGLFETIAVTKSIPLNSISLVSAWKLFQQMFQTRWPAGSSTRQNRQKLNCPRCPGPSIWRTPILRFAVTA